MTLPVQVVGFFRVLFDRARSGYVLHKEICIFIFMEANILTEFSYGFPSAGFPMLFKSFLHVCAMVSMPGDRLHPGVIGRLLVFLWFPFVFPYGFPMVFLLLSYGFPFVFPIGFPMVFREVFFRVFPWFSCQANGSIQV